MSPRMQTLYGQSSQNSQGQYLLEWGSKTHLLGMLDGSSFSDIVAAKMKKEGTLHDFLKSVQHQALTGGQKSIKVPKEKIMSEDDEADFTSCRVNDLPRDFAWGVATAAY